MINKLPAFVTHNVSEFIVSDLGSCYESGAWVTASAFMLRVYFFIHAYLWSLCLQNKLPGSQAGKLEPVHKLQHQTGR